MTQSLVNASDRWKPLNQLLTELVDRIAAEIPGCLGAALAVGHDGGPVSVLATHGVGEHFAPAQLRLGGPIADAFATGERVTGDDVFGDGRWPGLTREALTEAHPSFDGEWARVRGVVALPGLWAGDRRLVLSATLDRAVGGDALPVLARYEKLTADTLVVAEAAAAGDPDQMLGLLASRAVIEEAKGAIIAVRHCSPDEAWNTLRRGSQQFNVKVRDLAAALIELLSGAPAPQPDGTPRLAPGAEAREAAGRLWAAFTADPP